MGVKAHSLNRSYCIDYRFGLEMKYPALLRHVALLSFFFQTSSCTFLDYFSQLSEFSFQFAIVVKKKEMLYVELLNRSMHNSPVIKSVISMLAIVSIITYLSQIQCNQ